MKYLQVQFCPSLGTKGTLRAKYDCLLTAAGLIYAIYFIFIWHNIDSVLVVNFISFAFSFIIRNLR